MVFVDALVLALFLGLDREKTKQSICQSHIIQPLQSMIRRFLFTSLRKDTEDADMLQLPQQPVLACARKLHFN